MFYHMVAGWRMSDLEVELLVQPLKYSPMEADGHFFLENHCFNNLKLSTIMETIHQRSHWMEVGAPCLLFFACDVAKSGLTFHFEWQLQTAISLWVLNGFAWNLIYGLSNMYSNCLYSHRRATAPLSSYVNKKSQVHVQNTSVQHTCKT